MGEQYSHLTEVERIEFYAMRKAGYRMAKIAARMNRHVSSLYRELARNRGERGYRPKQAQAKAEARQAEPKYRKMTGKAIEHIEDLLREDWSPVQISSQIQQVAGCSISHERIYQHVYDDKAEGGTLHLHLRIANGKKRRKRYAKKDRRGRIPNRTDIDQRPEEINKRLRYGDWEADLVSGAHHRGFLVTLVERKSRLTLIGHVLRKTSEAVTDEITKLFKSADYPVLSVTFDNGKEFADHMTIADRFQCDTFFAKPYHSWERGTNENTNGLIRQYFPKKADLRNVSEQELRFAMDRLNCRPRKVLDFRRPIEVLSQAA